MITYPLAITPKLRDLAVTTVYSLQGLLAFKVNNNLTDYGVEVSIMLASALGQSPEDVNSWIAHVQSMTHTGRFKSSEGANYQSIPKSAFDPKIKDFQGVLIMGDVSKDKLVSIWMESNKNPGVILVDDDFTKHKAKEAFMEKIPLLAMAKVQEEPRIEKPITPRHHDKIHFKKHRKKRG